jgi:hypothetical protein
VEPLTLLPEGRILATFWQQRPNREEAGLQAGAFERDSAPLLLFDSAGAIRATLGVWPGLERARVSLEGADARLPPPYGRTVLAQGRGSWVAITPTDSLDLSLYSDTALVLRLTSTRPTARPTPELIRAWEHTLTSDFPDVAPIYRRAIQAAPVIPSLPLIGALGLDGHGHIWLGSYTSPTDTLRQWIIVSDAGEVVGRIALPALHAHALPGHRELLDVYGDRIALRRETADGESFVEVRRVWP